MQPELRPLLPPEQQGQRAHAVMSLDEIKRTIDRAMALRRFHTLSFLGGEPLLYPELEAAVSYAVESRPYASACTPMPRSSVSTGPASSRAWASAICMRTSTAIRAVTTPRRRPTPGAKSCAAMFRKLGDVNFGFGVIVHEEDLPQLPGLAALLRRHADVVRFVNLSLFGPLPRPGATFAERVAEAQQVDAFSAPRLPGDCGGFRRVVLLVPGEQVSTPDPGKLLAVSAHREGRLLGSLSPHEFRAVVEGFSPERGLYPYLLRPRV